MKNFFLASVVLFALASCGRDESEIQQENVAHVSAKTLSKSASNENPYNGYYTIYRYYSNSLSKHYFGAITSPDPNNGYFLEGTAFKLYASGNGNPLWLMHNPNNKDLVITSNPVDRNYLEAQGYVLREGLGWEPDHNGALAVPVYRYYQPKRSGHFYTTNFTELGTGGNGWKYEGIFFYALQF